MNQQNPVQTEITPLNHKQLAAEYKVTHKTLKSWLKPILKEIGEMRGKTFNVRQLRIIYENLGDPPAKTAQERQIIQNLAKA